MLLSKVPEISEVMVYGKTPEDNRKEKEELIITARVIPNMEEIEKAYEGELTDERVHEIIWKKIKEVNKQLTSYKAIKLLEIKKDEFEKTSTMKIKRYKEINK